MYKRQAIAIATIPIVGLGVTLWESLQVRKYAQKVEGRFERFAKETVKAMEKQVEFNEELIKVYESLGNQVHELACNVDIDAYEILRGKKFQSWKALTNTLLSGVLQNKLTIGVLPEVLPLDYIKQMTNSSGFQKTIYQDRPETVFTLGRLTFCLLYTSPSPRD